MRLTKKQREQVVELLRCAADLHGRETFPFAYASADVDADWNVDGRAWEVFRAVYNEHRDRDLLKHALLEAAQRVEEGTWP